MESESTAVPEGDGGVVVGSGDELGADTMATGEAGRRVPWVPHLFSVVVGSGDELGADTMATGENGCRVQPGLPALAPAVRTCHSCKRCVPGRGAPLSSCVPGGVVRQLGGRAWLCARAPQSLGGTAWRTTGCATATARSAPSRRTPTAAPAPTQTVRAPAPLSLSFSVALFAATQSCLGRPAAGERYARMGCDLPGRVLLGACVLGACRGRGGRFGGARGQRRPRGGGPRAAPPVPHVRVGHQLAAAPRAHAHLLHVRVAHPLAGQRAQVGMRFRAPPAPPLPSPAAVPEWRRRRSVVWAGRRLGRLPAKRQPLD